MKHTININKNSGFTIVEIMIAVAVSLILMLGVMQIFAGNKRAHSIGAGLATVQENARFALKKITADMRMAGYVGCSGGINNMLDQTDPNYDPNFLDIDNATGGWEFSNGVATSVTQPGETYPLSTIALDATESHWDDFGDNDLPADLDGSVIAGSDVLVLKWAAGDGLPAYDIKNINLKSRAIVLDTGTAQIDDGTLLIITDCSSGDAFQFNGNASSKSLTAPSSGSPGNDMSVNFSHQYPNGAEVLLFVSRAYYVGLGISGEPALYKITFVQGASGFVTEEIAEGIENMQVLYGVDVTNDNIADRYITAQQVTDHGQVVSLKVGIIARSGSEVKESASSQTFNLLGTSITTPNDRRLRYAFTTTVKIRNKGIK